MLDHGCALFTTVGSTEMDMHPVSDPPALSCRIDVQNEDGIVLLRGEMSGHTIQNGHYRLRLIKTGQSGKAEISQGGSFSVAPGQIATTGSSRIGLEQGARLTAILVLETPGGRHECRQEEISSHDR